jgi:hypothetical protein
MYLKEEEEEKKKKKKKKKLVEMLQTISYFYYTLSAVWQKYKILSLLHFHDNS